MAKRTRRANGNGIPTTDYRHPHEHRINIPPARIAGEGEVPRVPKVRYRCNPHLPPVLRFDPTGRADRLPELIAEAGRRPLTADEQKVLADALRHHQPWLEWAGKQEEHERGYFDVDPVALHSTSASARRPSSARPCAGTSSETCSRTRSCRITSGSSSTGTTWIGRTA